MKGFRDFILNLFRLSLILQSFYINDTLYPKWKHMCDYFSSLIYPRIIRDDFRLLIYEYTYTNLLDDSLGKDCKTKSIDRKGRFHTKCEENRTMLTVVDDEGKRKS